MTMAWRRLRDEAYLVAVAVQFLTRLPVPAWVAREPWHPDSLNRCVRHFPLVGALVGGAGAGVAWSALLVWPPTVAATLAVTTTLWLTTAFHEDGLADTADALLGTATRERALAIMKDSRIGTYGAAALALALWLRVSLLAEMLGVGALLGAAALVAMHAGARAAAVVLMATLAYGGDEAHAKAKPLARSVRPRDAAWATATGASLLCLPWLAEPRVVHFWHGAAAAAALALMVVATRMGLRRRLGGYTGDTLGACEQLGEIAVALAFVALWP